MSAVNIPGFTADASLYETSGYDTYRAPSRFGPRQTGAVMPQMPQSGGHILCTAGGCHCNSEERCNAMFSAPGLCGDNAYCTENAYHCSF
jgi:hypothetical protein